MSRPRLTIGTFGDIATRTTESGKLRPERGTGTGTAARAKSL